MKVIVSVVFLCFFLAAGLWAEAQTPGFAGTWIYDAEKSDPTSRSIVVDYDFSNFSVVGAMEKGAAAMLSKDLKSADSVVLLILEPLGNDEWKLSGVRRTGSIDIPFINMLKCDGKKRIQMVPGNPYTADMVKQSTKATLKKDKLRVEQIVYYPTDHVKSRNTFSLSKDEQTLILERESFDTKRSYGKKIYIQRLVFHRQ